MRMFSYLPEYSNLWLFPSGVAQVDRNGNRTNSNNVEWLDVKK